MKIRWIQKQSGHIEKFDSKKLERSITSAFHHANLEARPQSRILAKAVHTYLAAGTRDIVDADMVCRATMHILKTHAPPTVAEGYELAALHLHNLTIHGVIKRNGSVRPFHPIKLFKSIKKSFSEAGIQGGKISEELTRTIIASIEKDYTGVSISSREIQKRTAELLIKKGFIAVEKRYTLHKYS